MAGVRNFAAAQIGGTGIPLIADMLNAASQTYKTGALVLIDGSGLIAECGANPASVFGVAASPPASYPGYQAANSPAVVTGRSDHTPIFVANSQTVYSGRGINGATDPAIPVQANIGVQYGVTTVGGIWVINIADTMNKVVQITGIDADPNMNIFFFKIIPSVRQAN